MKKIKETIEQNLNEMTNVDEIMPQQQEATVINTSLRNIPEKYYVYVPANLNVDRLISQNPPNIKYFQKDKLLYIVSLINAIPARLKDYDLEDANGYVPLNAEILKKRVREYNKYLQYLLNTGVLEKRNDSKYLANKFSSGYRFTTRYLTDSKRVALAHFTLRKAICNNFNDEEDDYIDTSERPLEYLEKWWNDNLQFDYEGALQYLNELSEIERKNGKQHYLRKYFARKLVIDKFRAKDYILHQDNKAGRVHTLLTQLKSELRPFIKYTGKNLVSIDIRNSQPYLALALLNPNAFIKNNLHNTLQLYNNRVDINSSIMLALSDENFEIKVDLQQYISLVTTGNFYENFGKLLVEKGIETERDEVKLRKITKEIMFASMFGHNNEKCEVKDKNTGKIRYIPNRGMILFRETFPTVHQIFKTIKMGKHNTLACMLQNLEAELVLHTACKIISEEKPNVPLYTLHDSIVTTEENAKYVQRVLSEVLLNAIGIAPTINRDEWILKEKVA